MAAYVRNNAWDNGGEFKDNSGNFTDLYWYAIGVRTMQKRDLNNPGSWWFFGAIHGEFVLQSTDPGKFPGWGFIPTPPAVPTSPLPSLALPAPFSSGEYWDQCQHAGWYFAPWHRGYLTAIEAQLRADIVSAGGPSDWALPYWNYFGPATQYDIPPAFTAKTLPDGTPNSLFVAARYGPDGTGDVYVPTAAAIAAHPNDQNYVYGPVTNDCMNTSGFEIGGMTGNGFGGDGPSVFLHFGQSTGDLENNPHNLVHVYVGGNQNIDGPEGLMTDPGLAALDPIFYLHHANIDRMWAIWNQSGNANPGSAGWTAGPPVRGFIQPMASAGGPTAWPYSPADVASLGLGATDYSYEEMPAAPATPSAATLLSQRLVRLGAVAAAAAVKEGTRVTPGTNTELVGASMEQTLPVKGTGARSTVRLDPSVRNKVSASLTAASPSAPPDRVYLTLENIRGTNPASVLSVYINLPEGANPNEHPELRAGSVGLFGLRQASAQTGEHAGNGLTFSMDITRIIDQLHVSNALNSDSIHVTVIPYRPMSDASDITIGRIGIYRRGR